MRKALRSKLEQFRTQKIFNLGSLGTVLVITRRSKKLGLPLDPESLITKGGGQVAGLSGNAINRILKEHGIDQRVGTESGRTSRGTPNLARSYAALLNQLHQEGLANLKEIESWWVKKFVDHFNTEPFNINYDQSKTLRALLENLLEQAIDRQKRSPGKTYVGTVLQHLVGAKLELALPDVTIVHRGSSVADIASARIGDFVIDDTVIHCTTTPQDHLLAKCKSNLQAGKRPIILTTAKMIGAAETLADTVGIQGRVEIIDALQFVTMNLYELSLFKTSQRQLTVDKLVSKYNELVSEHEADPSLQISVPNKLAKPRSD